MQSRSKTFHDPDKFVVKVKDSALGVIRLHLLLSNCSSVKQTSYSVMLHFLKMHFPFSLKFSHRRKIE